MTKTSFFGLNLAAIFAIFYMLNTRVMNIIRIWKFKIEDNHHLENRYNAIF